MKKKNEEVESVGGDVEDNPQYGQDDYEEEEEEEAVVTHQNPSYLD